MSDELDSLNPKNGLDNSKKIIFINIILNLN